MGIFSILKRGKRGGDSGAGIAKKGLKMGKRPKNKATKLKKLDKVPDAVKPGKKTFLAALGIGGLAASGGIPEIPGILDTILNPSDHPVAFFIYISVLICIIIKVVCWNESIIECLKNFIKSDSSLEKSLNQDQPGGGRKLMNVNILLTVFVGYLLFYLYERYSEMITKEKELKILNKN